MNKRFLNVKEVAIYLASSEDTIRQWVKTGYMPFSKLGRSVRFDLLKLEPWLEKRECKYAGK